MKKIKALGYKCLRQKLPSQQLTFATTDEIKSCTEFVGQERALEALNFGIGIIGQGYNLYAMGPSGIGKRTFVSNVLLKKAAKKKTPPDWCYIHNFEIPEKPIALELPPGFGLRFQQDMKLFIEEVGASIQTVIESKDYRSRMKKIHAFFTAKRNTMRKKNKHLKQDKTLDLYKEQQHKEKQWQLKLISSVIKPAHTKLKKKYAKFPAILSYLASVRNDIVNHVNDFIKQYEKINLLTFSQEIPALTKYKVNLLVDNSNQKGAPIIFEESPCYSTLLCRVEHTNQQGSLATNFTLIRAGSLHRANGGYLLIEARKLKKNPDAWEALKSALYAQKINIKPIENDTDAIKPVSLAPEPIPLNTKIILLGSRNIYYSLCQKDPDFMELFKVPIDFDEQIERNKKNIKLYAQLIGTISQRRQLRPFKASAVAAIIDQSSRLAEDVEKLTTHIRNIEDLITEADYWASIHNKKIVDTKDVKQAIMAQAHRMDRSRELYYEDIYRDYIIIHTTGSTVGQVNCLSVRKVGDFSYGHPTRVTARVRLGKGKIIDIQREIKMAGPLHSKAGLIISNFLASRFSQEHSFSLYASLAFEQIYCWTDGDSASIGELCALLSALAEIPIHQFFAVTGSVDQYGNVQAIGGINEKIEGFYDVCKAKGLTGKQGVLIPAVNKMNLMLREDIMEAAKANQFYIYPIDTIDDAITLLTGYEAGIRNKKGSFPKNSIYFRIENRLQKFSKTREK